MDLVPILTRAESLFKRFERSVQAIDKKDNFPAAPTAHQRRPANNQDSPSNKGKSPQRPAIGSSSGVSGPSSLQQTVNADKPKVISPELRELLRKDIPWRRQQSP
jgi:DNA-nicking Smr family endonuclease